MGLFDFQNNTQTNTELSFNSTQKRIKLIDYNAIQILDDNLKHKIKNKGLSPSTVNKINSSIGDWIMSTFIEPDISKSDNILLDRGKWFHSIMEYYFSNYNENERNEIALKESIKKVSLEQYPYLLKNEENKEWLKTIFSHFNKEWLEKTKKDKIACIYMNGQQQKGIELFVNGNIGNCKRIVNGFIDKLIEGENGLIIQDWKTGKHIENYNPNKKISNENRFDYWLQQTCYAILLEQKGMVIESAELWFPEPETPTIITVDCNNNKIRDMVIEHFENAEKELNNCINNDFTFPFHKGKYNGWATLLCGMGNEYKPNIYQEKLEEILEM